MKENPHIAGRICAGSPHRPQDIVDNPPASSSAFVDNLHFQLKNSRRKSLENPAFF